jgi:transposase
MKMLYPSDLTDDQWQVIKAYENEKRKRKHDIRSIINAILYVVKTGCQWRYLPREYPKWQVVYYYFQCLSRQGTLSLLQQHLVEKVRHSLGKEKGPSAAIVDAQSVKSTLVTPRTMSGYDGGKKIKGIKRHVVVDTQGLPLSVVVHSAAVADRKGGAFVLEQLAKTYHHIKIIFCDGGYPLVGKADEPMQKLSGYDLCVVKRNKKEPFSVLPKRWVVERTFAWIEVCRRNAKCYERTIASAEAMIQLSLMPIMLKRLNT